MPHGEVKEEVMSLPAPVFAAALAPPDVQAVADESPGEECGGERDECDADEPGGLEQLR